MLYENDDGELVEGLDGSPPQFESCNYESLQKTFPSMKDSTS